MVDNQTKDLFVFNRILLQCAGLWTPPNCSRFLRILYKFYAIFIFLFVNIFFTSTEFISLFYTYKNLYKFIKNINFFLTHFMGAVKVIFWYYNGTKLISLMSTLEDKEFIISSNEEILRKFKYTGIKYTIMFFALAHMTLTSSYLPPLLTTIFNPPEENKEDFYRTLPYYSWMPFKHETRSKYLIALGYQAGPMFSYAYSIVGMDTLFMNLLNFIAAHFTILQHNFLAINLDGHQKAKMYNGSMKKNCRHLQIIFSVCDMVERLYSVLNLAQATATLFILCTSLYLISTTPFSDKQFYAEIVYMIAMCFQLFMYCWFGNELTLQAFEIIHYNWCSNWLQSDKQFKKCLIFTMMRLSKPIYMTMGNFAPLTLTTFMKILKASYSVFAVLKNREM